MIKTVIVEDDAQAIDIIISIVHYYNIEINILGFAQTIEKAKEIIESSKPDLLLLDIELPDGNSLDLLKQLSYKPWVIFITGHSDYIFDSLDYPTIHYLIKPLSADKLIDAIIKYQNIVSMFEQTKKTEQDKLKIKKLFEKIAIPTSSGIILVEQSKIVRLEGEGNYSYLYLADGQKILISKTLSTFEQFLPDDLFVRVHKSHLINISYIRTILKTSPPYLVMYNLIEIPISPSKKDILISKLQESIIFVH